MTDRITPSGSENGGPDEPERCSELALCLRRPAGMARTRLLPSGEPWGCSPRGEWSPAVDEAGVLALAAHLGRQPARKATRGWPRVSPAATERSIDPQQVAVALAEPDEPLPDATILAETVALVQSTGHLAAWWALDLKSDTLELRVRPADSGELVAPVVQFRHCAPQDPDALRKAILAELVGPSARHVLRSITQVRRRDWIPVAEGHRLPVWVARDVYQQLVAEAVAEPGRVCTVQVRARRPQQALDGLAAAAVVDLAGVELRPSSIELHGEHHLVLVGQARFVAGG